MQQTQPGSINPDLICQQAVQAKLNVYQAKEHFESVLKIYNDHVDNLINLVQMMKARIMELETEKGKQTSEKKEMVNVK
jgi:hypothetical protein